VIFCAKNEDGVPTWKLVLEGKKTVTRRLKPMPIGKEFAIQPGRGKKAVARGKVINCEVTFNWWFDWVGKNMFNPFFKYKKRQFLKREAYKEGFKTWKGLSDYFHQENKGLIVKTISGTYRIEFELVKEDKP
jgi:hypothetical protein